MDEGKALSQCVAIPYLSSNGQQNYPKVLYTDISRRHLPPRALPKGGDDIEEVIMLCCNDATPYGGIMRHRGGDSVFSTLSHV